MEDSKFYMFTALFAVLIIIFGYSVMYGSEKDNYNENTVSVDGYAESSIIPDEAYIYFTIEEKAKSSKDAQDAVEQKLSKVKTDVAANSSLKLETQGYNVREEEYYDNNTYQYKKTGLYVVSHRLKVTSKDISNISDIIGMLSTNGITNIENVYFGLSKESEASEKNRLWTLAVQDAKTKAETIAKAAGTKLESKPKNITISNYTAPVYYNMALSARDVSEKAYSVLPQDQKISVSVNLVYEYN